MSHALSSGQRMGAQIVIDQSHLGMSASAARNVIADDINKNRD